MSTEHRSIPVAVNRPAPEGAPRFGPDDDAGPVARPAHTPLIDIHEGPDGLVLEADLPGVSENDVTIQLEENVLNLHARVTSPVPEGARVLHEEYRPGDYARAFILSDEVERSRIAAELKNGVLRLTLPKAERAKTRRIEIKS
jgi:HSP20 family molecular chaperone IbpA